MDTSKLRSVIESLSKGKPVILSNDPFDEGVFDQAAWNAWRERDTPRVIEEAMKVAREKSEAITAARSPEKPEAKVINIRSRYVD